jgi:hypothetical protein
MSEENGTDLKRAVDALMTKGPVYTRLWEYYDGEQPLVYSTQRLRKIFDRIEARFTQNWCGVVVDAVLDRLALTRFHVAQNDKATNRLAELFEDTEMALDDELVHQAAMVCGEAFVIAGKDEDGTVEAYYNDARMCHAFYDPDHPRRMTFACKWWDDAEGRRRLTLYYPDRLEHYVSHGKAENVHNWQSFEPADPDRELNEGGFIPVAHFRKERRGIISELTSSIRSQQDAVNKLLADMMVSAEFGAFRQRYIISNAKTGHLKNAPNEIWEIPAGMDGEQTTQVGEFAESSLTGFLDAIDRLASAMAICSRTPKHFFWKQGGDPSGEALIAAEAPLNKKAERYIERFGVSWGRVGWMLLKLDGLDVDEGTIEPIYEAPETVHPQSGATTAKTRVEAGMPLRTVLRRYEAWTEDDLDEMASDKEQEEAGRAAGLAQAMLNQQRMFDGGVEET